MSDIKRALLAAMDVLEHPGIISPAHVQQRIAIQSLPDSNTDAEENNA